MINDNAGNGTNWWALLNARRLPARLTADQTARVLGFQAHDIPALVRAQLLRPLGDAKPNSVKYFTAAEVVQKGQDVKWLDRATKAVARRRKFSKESQNLGQEAAA